MAALHLPPGLGARNALQDAFETEYVAAQGCSSICDGIEADGTLKFTKLFGGISICRRVQIGTGRGGMLEKGPGLFLDLHKL